MKLTASPFNPVTGELLPVYRDAYLRGDLSSASAQAVEAYLHHDADTAYETLTRWQQLLAEQEATAAPTWIRKQLQYIRAEPVRFRNRALSMVGASLLVGSMVFAGTHLPTNTSTNLPTAENISVVAAPEATGAEASAMRTMTVRGRILNEDGAPLVGATVMQAGSTYGVSTNERGEYMLRVPVGTKRLQYGYGGYQEEELIVKSSSTANVTLLPREEEPVKKKKRWLFF